MIFRFTTVVFAMVLIGLLIHRSDAADPGVRKQSQRRLLNNPIEKKKERRLKAQANPSEKKPVVKAQQVEKSGARYQMLSAGNRVVVLDTHTGETKVIEPQMRPAYQNVEVGRAWVVVTVLGNVSEIVASDHDE